MKSYKIIFMDNTCAYIISEHEKKEEAEQRKHILVYETNEYKESELMIVKIEEGKNE